MIAHWNAIALRTSLAQGAGAQYYLGVSSAAVYNAVVTIEGGFEPYLDQPRAHAHASPEAAAATAAYRVLVAMFPEQEAALTADLRASLAQVPNGVGKVHGVRVGEQAAAAVLRIEPVTAMARRRSRRCPWATTPVDGGGPHPTPRTRRWSWPGSGSPGRS